MKKEDERLKEGEKKRTPPLFCSIRLLLSGNEEGEDLGGEKKGSHEK